MVRDRNPDYVQLADGAVRNGYTLKLMNRSGVARTLKIGLSGIKARQIRVIGDGDVVSSIPMLVPADKVRTVRLLVTVARDNLSASRSLTFTLMDETGKETHKVDAVFVPGAAR